MVWGWWRAAGVAGVAAGVAIAGFEIGFGGWRTELEGMGACARSADAGGGVAPPRVRVEIRPAFWKERRRLRCRFVSGTEVKPRRALEAFWRCEQRCARLTRDIFGGALIGELVGWKRWLW